jgi:hypothetical protein
VSLSGTIHASNANISFANPITLIEDTTLNSNGGGDILISDTIDGAFDLIYTAGTGSITLAADIGATIPVSSLTITTAANVSTQAISAGTIVQNAGTGTTTFHGALATTLPSGISLTGTGFGFEASITTDASGALTIANSGLLTLPSSASMMLNGNFRQTGAGAVSLGTTIEIFGTQILLTGPVTLIDTATLDLETNTGTISFLSTIDGNEDLIFDGGLSSIFIGGAVGGTTPVAALQVIECTNFTSRSIRAASLDIENVSGTATFNGALSTTGISGMTFSGHAFDFEGSVTTTSGGPLSIDNLGQITIGPSLAISLTGAFTQTGPGTIAARGSLSTAGDDITFAGPLQLLGDLSLSSAGGDIHLGADIEGAYSVTITAGTGDVALPRAISISAPLNNFTVVSAHDISISGIGSDVSRMTGTLSLSATDTIALSNTTYSVHSIYLASDADIDFINPGLVTMTTDGGSITFASDITHLNSGTDLSIQTGGGAFSFHTLHGTDFENFTVDTGSGLASLGTLSNIGSINSFTVAAGSIVLNGPIDDVNTSFTSNSSILNAGSPVDITSANTAFFNAINGNVGSLASPILVHTSNQIIAGGTDLAVFEGSSIDNTVHAYAPNPPCVIIFNGATIQDCGVSPPTSSQAASSLIGFPSPGFDSSQFNLASDFYFLFYFIDEKYFRGAYHSLIYIR